MSKLAITTLLSLLVGPSLAQASTTTRARVHTALVAFDACEPMADGQVVAGSAGGLVVVDAANRQRAHYTSLDGLPGTRVHALLATKRGLWVGTEGGAALVGLEGAVLKVKESFTTKPVRDLVIDHTGEGLYVATWGQGVLHYSSGSLSALHTSTVARETRVTSLAKEGKGLVWGTAGAGLWSRSEAGLVERRRGQAAGAVIWSTEMAGDALWIGGQDGAHVAGQAPSSSALHSVRATALVGEVLMAASFGGGLQSLSGRRINAPSDKFARSLQSAHGTSCLGTQEALWIRRDKGWKRAILDSGLPANDISAFASDGKQTFVGLFERGVARLVDKRFEPLAIEMDPHVNALAIDTADGALWIGTSTELVRYHDGRVNRFSKRGGLPSKHIMSLCALPGGGVLVGTAAGGATVLDGVVEPLGGKGGIVTGNVWAVTHTADGTHWLGSTRGVFRVRGTRFTRYGVASGELKDDWVMALAPAANGVFVGTYKAGVVRLEPSEEGMQATQLGEGWVNPGGLSWDGQVLRVATMHGPLLGNGVDAAWRKAKTGPGLDTTAFLATNGAEWIATRRGLVRRASRP